MVKFTQAGADDDGPERYNEVIGSSTLADTLKERQGMLRGGFSINGTEFRNFEANSPDSVVSQINMQRQKTGVSAALEDGHLKLWHQSPEPIRIQQGMGYQKPNKPGEAPEPPAENTILDDLGLDETTELNEAHAAQMSAGNGAVAQFGDGQAVQVGAAMPSGSQFQTADEIEAANRAMMQNPRGPNPMGGRAPHAPHESVPGSTTTGNRPQPEAPESNVERAIADPQTGAPKPADETDDQRRAREQSSSGQMTSDEADRRRVEAERDANKKAERDRQLEEERKAEEARRSQQGGQPNPTANPPAA